MRIFGPSKGRVEHLLDDPDAFYPGEAEFETASFLRAMRAAVPALPDPALEAGTIHALASAARTASLEAAHAATGPIEPVPEPPRAAPRWRLRVAALAAVVAALPLLMTGLAFAGLNLPGAVDDAFEAIGIDLPNQGSERTAAGSGGKDETKASKDAAGAKGTDDAATAGAGNGTAGEQGSDEPDEGKATGKPEHAGQESTPPGQGGTPPGQGGVIPGTGEETPSPAPAGPPPSAGPPATPPGHGGTPPGQGGVPPGQASP